jgi:hypothetical protein
MTANPRSFKKSFLLQPEWVLAASITLLAVWLHIFFLFHAGGFWRDEVNSINLAGSHSLGDMAKDSFPVLMPLLIHGWSSLGLAQSELELRCLGTLIGLGIVAALWVVSWAARGAPPLLGLALLALNSPVIYYGDSLRSYGLGSLLIMLAAVAAWAFLKKPSSLRAGIFAAVAVLNVQTLYQNAVLFAAICLGAWVICWRRKNWRAALKILAAGLIAAASLLPYCISIPQLFEDTSVRRAGFLPKMSWDNVHTITAFPLPPYAWVWGLLAIFLVAFGCKTFFTASPRSNMSVGQTTADDLKIFAGTTFLAVFAGFVGFLWFSGLRTQPWYFLPPIALTMVCIEFGLSHISPYRYFRALSFGLIAATALIATPFATRDLNYRFTNVDLVAKQLMINATPQDFVVVTPWYFGISFEHYFKGLTPWNTLPPLKDHSFHRYDLVQQEMLTTNAFQPVLDQITKTLQGGHRVWVVGWMYIPAPGAPPTHDATGQFIINHSLRFEQIDGDPRIRVNDLEDVDLMMASGWRNSDPPPASEKIQPSPAK